MDIVVAGIGTGGTISGVGRFLKSQNPNIKVTSCYNQNTQNNDLTFSLISLLVMFYLLNYQVIGVEPTESNILSGGKPGEVSKDN